MKNQMRAFLSKTRWILPLLLQSAANAAGTETNKSLLDLYKEGGPVMHLIALCSVAAMALAVFSALTFRKTKLLPPSLIEKLNTLLSHKNLEEAYRCCQSHPGPLTQALASALTKANYERDMYNKAAMENAVADECFRAETKMMSIVNYLNTLAVLAPMIGLLGTVSGMISSFSALTAGKAEAADLSKGIGEALVATGGGLLLAIPSMFLYFAFRGLIASNMADVHATLSHMLDRFTGEAHGAPPPAVHTHVYAN